MWQLEAEGSLETVSSSSGESQYVFPSGLDLILGGPPTPGTMISGCYLTSTRLSLLISQVGVLMPLPEALASIGANVPGL